MTSNHAPRASRQTGIRTDERGISLIVVLLILLVVTVLGLSAAQMSMLGAKTTRYNRDHQVAWEAAEAALVDAQYDINNSTNATRAAYFTGGNKLNFVTDCGTGSANQGLCLPAATGATPIAYTVDFTATGNSAHTVALGTYTGRTFMTGNGIAPVQAPRYIIEVIEDNHTQSSLNTPSGFPMPLLYRITAMGFGPRQEVQVVTQVVYRKGA